MNWEMVKYIAWMFLIAYECMWGITLVVVFSMIIFTFVERLWNETL